MKRNKITVRLIVYFTFALLLFSLLTGAVFAWQFSRYSVELHRQDLEERAVRIAETLEGFMGTSSGSGAHGRGTGGGGQNSGYGAYLRFIDDIAMTDVWIVEHDAGLITRGHGHSAISYKELPDGAEEVIAQIHGGEIAFSESFSPLLEQKTLTVGAPIFSDTGAISGAVLLHSPLHGYETVQQNQLQIMGLSILLALLLTVPIAITLSLRFTKPLGQMKQNALLLAEENYQARNNLRQQDEIGELANSMDLLAARLQAAKQEREQVEESRRIFLSNVSHELRTPVTVMRGSLEALCDQVVTDPQQVQEYHQQMLRESIHMQRLVNDLLELSRLQSPDFTMQTAPVNLGDVVADVARSMRPIAEKKNIAIQTTMQNAQAKIEIIGDYSRLRQMLLIVVDNAIKFAPPASTVAIHGEESDASYLLTVTDHGEGIAPALLPHVFERFHKQNSAMNQHGSGLGLAIAKEIAERHRVTISVESRPGNTQFHFMFLQKP